MKLRFRSRFDNIRSAILILFCVQAVMSETCAKLHIFQIQSIFSGCISLRIREAELVRLRIEVSFVR